MHDRYERKLEAKPRILSGCDFQPLLENNSPARLTSMHSGTKYSKLENEIESPQRQFLQKQQMYEVQNQDEQLEAIADSLGSLKTVSRHIGIELDEQQG